MLPFATISKIGKLVNDVPSQDRAIQTFPLKQRSIHLSIKVLLGLAPRPTTETIVEALIGIQGPPVGLTSYCPSRTAPFPEQASSHGLAVARPWARAAPTRPQPGCFSSHPGQRLSLNPTLCTWETALFPTSLGSFPPQSFQLDSRFLEEGPPGMCFTQSYPSC